MIENKFVVAIKVNGKVLRENKEIVSLPYGTEFSVLVKNLNSRRAKFNLSIDGSDALDGTEIIVNANSESEIKRFIRNGNMDEGNAFKFIERTSEIEEGPRGIKMDDGIVRVQYWFEQEVPTTVTTRYTSIFDRTPYIREYYPYSTWCQNATADIKDVKLRSREQKVSNKLTSCSIASGVNSSYSTSGTVNDAVTLNSAAINDIGITVPGSKIDQKFSTVYGFNSEAQSHVIILRLAGYIGDTKVAEPITVKSVQKCSTCGKTNKMSSKFCSTCGTSLQLI